MIHIECTQDDMIRIINCVINSITCPLDNSVRCRKAQDCKTCLGKNIDWNIIESEEN